MSQTSPESASEIWSDANLINLMTAVSKANPNLTEQELFKEIAFVMIKHLSHAQTPAETRYRAALEQIAGRTPKKNPLYFRIVCPVCNWKSVEPHTEARHAPNCAGEVARAALAHSSIGRKAPASCPDCYDETDCANVDICCALSSPERK